MPDLHISQTQFFGRIVSDCMDSAPPQVNSETSCQEAVRLLCKHKSSSIIVTDMQNKVLGILTEHDIAHRLAFQIDGSIPVGKVISSPIINICEHDYLFHGIAVMRRYGLRHLPVLNRQGELKGILHQHEALGEAMPKLLNLIERLTHESNIVGLRQVKTAQVELAESLFIDRIPTPEIQSLLTHINNDIYRRILECSLNGMVQEGWGEPPVKFDVIIMGSGGRGESFLFPDQDNGFIFEDYPDEQHPQVDYFFTELATRMSQALDQIGIPLCKGFVMASNPLWRKSLTQWKQQVNGWFSKPNTKTLRLSDIFFDFRGVYGQRQMSIELRQYLIQSVKKHYRFLQEMHRVQTDHGVALGLFGRLSTDRTPGPHQGQLNLKYHGLLPLVEAVRLLALREGLMHISTLRRIEALHEKLILDNNEQDYLVGAFHLLTRLILRQQLNDFRANAIVGPYVPLQALSKREKTLLVDSLKAIQRLRERVRSEFTADIF